MRIRNLLLYLMLLCSAALGQSLKSTPAAKSFLDYRPIGDQRIWTFVSRDSTLGRLISIVRDKKTVNGREGLVVQEELGIDMSKIGGSPLSGTSAKRWISLEGFYLGEETRFSTEGRTNDLQYEVKGGQLSGFFTRDGEKVQRDIPWVSDRFVYEPFFVDEFEAYLAMRGLKVGDKFQDSTFEPSTLLSTPIAGDVENFIYTELYKGKFDSVYVVRLTQPEQFTLLITPDYRLLRVDFPGVVRLRAYLDRVARPQAPTAGASVVPPKVSALMVILRVIHWAVYVIVGSVILLFFVRRQYRPWPNWIGLFSGCVAYMVVIFAQFPIQKWMFEHWIAPMVGTGGGVLAIGVIPSLFAGLLQQAMILSIIIMIFRRHRVAGNKLALVGAFVGAGFAMAEAFYQTEPGPVWSWQLLERSSMLLLHISAGYLIGYLMALKRGVWVGFGLLVVANSFVRYLPLLLPQRQVTVATLHFVLAFVALIIAASAAFVNRIPLPVDVLSRTSEGPGTSNPLT